VQLPITIGLHRSSLLRAIFLGVAWLVLLSLAALSPIMPWLPFGLLLLAPLLLGTWRKLNVPDYRLRLERDGLISLQTGRDAEFRTARCLSGAAVHPTLCVFRLRDEADGKVHVMLVTVDSTSPEEFRRLRVFLRWRAVFSYSPSATE